MSDAKSRTLMEKIALILQDEDKGGDDTAYIRQNIDLINKRLDRIESRIIMSNSVPEMTIPKFLHPSQEKMRIIEELVEELFSDGNVEKACILETNKPCDNCSMCNSRGF